MKKPNSTVVLDFLSRPMDNYLEKWFYIIEKYSMQKSMLPNDVQLIINMIDQLDTDFS